MPLYEYKCAQCGEVLEVIQSFSSEPETICPKCGGSLRKLFSAPAIQFKGSGFYKTDYPSASASAASSSKSGESASSDSKSESKSDSRTESKSDSTSGSKGESKVEAKSESKNTSKPASE